MTHPNRIHDLMTNVTLLGLVLSLDEQKELVAYIDRLGYEDTEEKDHFNDTICDLEIKVGELEDEIKELEEDKRSLEYDNLILQKEVNDLEDEVENLKLEAVVLEKKLEELEIYIEHLQDKIGDYE